MRTLAFEQFRLRRRAGQAPTSDQYKERFGIDPARAIRDDRLDLVPGPRTPSPRTDRFAQVMAALPHVGDQFLDYRLLASSAPGHLAGRSWRNGPGGARRLKVGPAFGAEPLTRLRHPNIVPVEEVFHVGSFRAVVMPYLGGITLAHVLKAIAGLAEAPIRGVALFAAGRPELPPGELSVADAALRPALEAVYYADAVLWLAAQLADGLAYAHRQGVLHLDLKPANVLFSAVGRPMLLDFHPADHGITEEAGGTLPYMSPEQIDAFRGQPSHVDARSDLFSLGVLLYQFFTGRLPYAATRDTSASGLAVALEERLAPPPDPMAVNHAVPPPAAEIVRRLLAPDPAGRFSSCAILDRRVASHFTRLPAAHAARSGLVRAFVWAGIAANPKTNMLTSRRRSDAATFAIVCK